MNTESLLTHFERIAEAPDAVPRLRRFVLDLAVRGKLVEQDPKDEPASELLERMQKEKVRLVRDGKLRTAGIALRDEGYAHSYDLPGPWVWICLGDFAQYGIAEKVASNNEISADTWVLDLEDIEKDTSRLIERVSSSARPFRSTKTMFKRGNILFGKLRASPTCARPIRRSMRYMAGTSARRTSCQHLTCTPLGIDSHRNTGCRRARARDRPFR